MDARGKRLGTTLGFVGLGIALATMALWNRQIHQVAIPENRILFIVGFVAAALFGASAFVMRTRWFGAIPAVLAIAIGVFLPFTISISRQEVASTGIQVGQTIPLFTAIDRHGEGFDSASLEGKPVLMKFFRGHW